MKATIINPNIVTYIRTIRDTIEMTNNDITNWLTLKSTVKEPGHTWYDPTQVANIFGSYYLKDKT